MCVCEGDTTTHVWPPGVMQNKACCQISRLAGQLMGPVVGNMHGKRIPFGGLKITPPCSRTNSDEKTLGSDILTFRCFHFREKREVEVEESCFPPNSTHAGIPLYPTRWQISASLSPSGVPKRLCEFAGSKKVKRLSDNH